MFRCFPFEPEVNFMETLSRMMELTLFSVNMELAIVKRLGCEHGPECGLRSN